jgi:tetratricopeptide (TPR) repeat protein
VRSWPIGLLLAAVALVSAPRFGNGLVWDDVHLMDVAESLARAGDPLRAFRHSTLGLVHGDPERAERGGLDLYRPLVLLSFWAGYALSGRDPTPQHAINLALHLACTALVFSLALARGRERARDEPRARAVALLAAAWFGLSPPLAEAHVWISGRFDLLCALFTLIALQLWLAAVRRTGRARIGFDIAAGAVFAAALLAKEVALFVLLALPFWPGLGGSWRARVRRCAPFVAGLAAYMALRLAALGSGAGSEVTGARLLTGAARFGAVVIDAIVSLLVPLRVYSRLPKEDYDALGALGVLACALLAALLAYGAFRARQRLPWSAFGLLWLGALLAPVAVVTASAWPGFGRFLYLPATLFMIGAADAALFGYEHVRSLRARSVLRFALGVHLLWFALALHVYTFDWRDDDTLYRSIIAAAPDRSHGYGFLGITHIERSQYPQAAVLLRKAVEIAPRERRYLSKLGHALLFSGDVLAARALAEDAIDRLGDAPEFHLLAAYTWLESDPTRAARALLECLRQDPANAEGLEALTFLRTRHPRAERFRVEIERLAVEPRYAPLRPTLRRHAAATPRSSRQP